MRKCRNGWKVLENRVWEEGVKGKKKLVEICEGDNGSGVTGEDKVSAREKKQKRIGIRKEKKGNKLSLDLTFPTAGEA